MNISGPFFDVRELADGGPAGKRTNNGTGGKWIDLFGPDANDLTKLGIKEAAEEAYVVGFIVPAGNEQQILIRTLPEILREAGGISPALASLM